MHLKVHYIFNVINSSIFLPTSVIMNRITFKMLPNAIHQPSVQNLQSEVP